MNCLYCHFEQKETRATKVLVQPHPAVVNGRTAEIDPREIEQWNKTHGRVYLCTDHASKLQNVPGEIVDANS